MKYLFNHWDILFKKPKKNIALFLDYDGTLTPIVKTPQSAKLHPKTKSLLVKLSKLKNFKVSIISGRSLYDIKRMVNIKTLTYAGNHGLETRGTGIIFKSPVSKSSITLIKKIYTELRSKLFGFKGVLIENKNMTLSVHYRLADSKVKGEIIQNVKRIIKPYLKKKRIKLNAGKMVLEIKPAINWNKGKIVIWLLGKFRRIFKENIFPIYIGDDITDNDAFRALKRKGLSVYVGGRSNKFSADYFVKDTKEVVKFLKKLMVLYSSPRV